MSAVGRPPAIVPRIVRSLVAALRVVAVVAVAWAIVVGWPQLRLALATLADADRTLLLLALGLQLLALVLVATAYRAALAAAGARVGFRQAGGVALRAGAVSRLVPGGGAAAALFAMGRLRRSGIPDGSAVVGVAVHGVVMMAMLAAVVAVGSGSSLGIAMLSALGAAAVIVALGRPAVRGRLAGVAARLRGRRGLAGVAAAVATVAERPLSSGSLGAAVCAAAAAWCCELAALWFVVAGVAEPMSVPAVAMGLGAANAAAALPHTPGGVGVVEAAVTGAFVAMGADTSLALAGVLGYRAIGFWMPALIGLSLLGLDRLGRGGREVAVGEPVTP